MMTATTSLRETSRELASERVYEAPKELLMQMWSNPAHITNWWGPRGFTTTTHAMDFRTGGNWVFTMHGPDGVDYPNFIRYTNVSPDRIEYEQSNGVDVHFTASIEFREVDGGTRMSFRMTFPSAELLQELVEKFGAKEGLIDTLSRLSEYSSERDPKVIELVIVRQFAAPQDRVWLALTDPSQLRQWLCPIGMELEMTAEEPKVGGHWTTAMIGPHGMRFEADGEYLAIDPIEFLKMTHRWKKDDGSYKPTTTVSYRLHTFENKTTMTFMQSGFWSDEARAAHLGGWSSCVQKLAVLLGATLADRALELTRVVDAPLDLVWNCWTEPDRLAQWFAPRPYTCPKCEIDFRPGGTIHLVMRSPAGEEHAMISTIVDITPHSSFGWINSVSDDTGNAALRGGTMVFFEDLEGRTRVTVKTYAAAYTAPGQFMVGGMEQGWNGTLDQMVEVAENMAGV